jgi:type I restriction-modification system DNA methylase subunit
MVQENLMARVKKENNNKEEPIEKQLWKAAEKLRKNIDAAEYKHIVLGDAKARSADILGHVFEYFLGEFALAEGKKASS